MSQGKQTEFQPVGTAPRPLLQLLENWPREWQRILPVSGHHGGEWRAWLLDAAGDRWLLREQPGHISPADWDFHLRLLSLPGRPDSVPALLPTADGLPYAAKGRRRFSIQSALDGVPAPLHEPADFAAVGRLLGQLHAWLFALDRTTLPPRTQAYAADWRRHGANLGWDRRPGSLIAALLEKFPETAEPDFVPVHGDFHPFNLLWRQDRLIGVCDWEDAHLAPPARDLGSLIAHSLMIDWPEHRPGGYEAQARARLPEAETQALLTAYAAANVPQFTAADLLRSALESFAITLVLASRQTEKDQIHSCSLLQSLEGTDILDAWTVYLNSPAPLSRDGTFSGDL